MNKQILKYIIFAGLFALPFVPFLTFSSLFFPFITTKAFALRIIVEVILGAWVILALLDEAYRPKKSPILYAVLAFFLVIGVADLLGVSPEKSFLSNFERMEGFIALLHFGALFLIMGSVFKEIEWKRWWNTSLVASGLMGIYCLMQLAGTFPINQGGVRVDGTFGNAIYLSVYLLIHIFIAGLYLWRARHNSALKWSYGVLILFQLVILYHTATRGAILGLLGGLLVIVLLNLRNKEDPGVKKFSMVLAVTLLVVVGGFLAMRHTSFVQESPVLSRFASLNTVELKTQGRYFVWPMAVQGIKDRPILGWGQDNFIYVFQKYYNPAMYELEPWFDRAHNIFLDWAVAGGLLGLLAYLSLYVIFLKLVWKDQEFSHAEKSILTGLLVAYFFNNLFIFDNLNSYLLFFAILAYMYSRSLGGVWGAGKTASRETVWYLGAPVATMLLVAVLYFVSVKPIQTNRHLLMALYYLQPGVVDESASISQFKQAYSGSTLGRRETVEQIAQNTRTILSSDLSIPERNDFYQFAYEAVTKQASTFANDSRYQIMTSTFISSTSPSGDALPYITRAQELIPNKQQVYFELGAIHADLGDLDKMLESFKQAYDLAPDYREAKIIYLIGAIYTNDRALETKLRGELPDEILDNDPRLQTLYNSTAR